MLQICENEVLLCKWSGDIVQLHALMEYCPQELSQLPKMLQKPDG